MALLPFAGSEAFAGLLILRDAGSDELRGQAELPVAEPLAPGESTFPLGGEGELAPGRYTLRWGAPAYGLATAEFVVLDGNWTILSLNPAYGATS